MTSGVQLGTSGDVRFVQFPHPGAEHEMPRSGKRAWKRGDERHRRTFLQSPGIYRRAVDARDEKGEIAYWAEWEGGADLVAEVDPVPGGPRWLCRPDPSAPPPRTEDGTPPQNTDPYVWGDTMRYTFCRQLRNGKLRRLGRGSVILFGSSLHNQFVLDAVLVAAGWVDHESPDGLVDATDQAHMRATIEPMYGWEDVKRTYRLYFGATPSQRVNGMFSFVPCREANGRKSGFARPGIQVDGLFNPNARMQAKMLDVAEERCPELWKSVVAQVVGEGLLLGTQLELTDSAKFAANA